MIIYSPKSQKPDIFKKNTIKDMEKYNRNISNSESFINLELNNDNHEKDNLLINKPNVFYKRLFGCMKEGFYNRMKLFFDYNDKTREKRNTFELAEE